MPLGFAWSDATFASRREVAMPIEQFSPVACFHAS